MPYNTENSIQRYAELTAWQEYNAARGMDIPHDLKQEIAFFESRAQAVLSPDQLMNAQALVNSFKQEHHTNFASQEQAAQTRMDNAAADLGAKALTKGMAGQMDGLTAKQLRAVREGKDIPVQGKGFRYDPDRFDSISRQNTKDISKGGKGWSYDKGAEVYAEIMEAEGAGRPRETIQAILDKHAAPKMQQQLYDLAKANHNSTSQLKIEMAKRETEKGTRDTDHLVKPTESDKLRAEIAMNWVETNTDSEQDYKMMGGIDEAYLEDEHLTGDIARAMEKWITPL